MGKQRTTVTTCDGTDCKVLYTGQESPGNWLTVTVVDEGHGSKEKFSFHSYECLASAAKEWHEADDIVRQSVSD